MLRNVLQLAHLLVALRQLRAEVRNAALRLCELVLQRQQVHVVGRLLPGRRRRAWQRLVSDRHVAIVAHGHHVPQHVALGELLLVLMLVLMVVVLVVVVLVLVVMLVVWLV